MKMHVHITAYGYVHPVQSYSRMFDVHVPVIREISFNDRL